MCSQDFTNEIDYFNLQISDLVYMLYIKVIFHLEKLNEIDKILLSLMRDEKQDRIIQNLTLDTHYPNYAKTDFG